MMKTDKYKAKPLIQLLISVIFMKIGTQIISRKYSKKKLNTFKYIIIMNKKRFNSKIRFKNK